MDLALGTDASKSDAKDPVRFSALLGGPGKCSVFGIGAGCELKHSVPESHRIVWSF